MPDLDEAGNPDPHLAPPVTADLTGAPPPHPPTTTPPHRHRALKILQRTFLFEKSGSV